ncbi:MAG: hypothetical protein KGL03_07325, partial [Nitrospirota bacterium]|nr:hypothetical protein [Nitrospirota bacterium]
MPKRPGTKTALTPTEREDLFYEFLAGEARSSLLTSIVQMGLPALLADRGPMTEQDIIDALALHPQRGRKWLLLLRYVNLLEEAPEHAPRATPRYGNSPLVQALFMENGRGGYFYRDFLRYWNRSRSHDIAHVLRGG